MSSASNDARASEVQRHALRAELELLERARRGDHIAFGALVRKHDRKARELAHRLLGDPSHMDDVLQEAYIRAFRALPRFRAQASFSTWLYRIVYNACLDHLRKHQPAASGLESLELTSAESPLDLRLDLSAALATLSPDQRAAVWLCDAEGFTYPEAARIIGCLPGTVGSRLSRAHTHLRHVLRAWNEGGDRNERQLA